MTIGIAAHGPHAGAAILKALAAAERVARGAIGGFVSLAAIGSDGVLRRAETQRGGGASLLAMADLDQDLLASPVAVLMSSGPDRPVPLSQFTPGAAEVGLVTGHRFPNMPGRNGLPLNVGVLQRIEAGATPDDAVAALLSENPCSDAGLIAITPDGAIGLGNTAYLAGFSDVGSLCVTHGEHSDRVVAVLHNAIEPRGSLAGLVAELALAAMDSPPLVGRSLVIRSGIPVNTASKPALHVDGSLRLLSIDLVTATDVPFDLSAGYGPAAPVYMAGCIIGRTSEEPYLVVRSGRLLSINGISSVEVGLAP